MATIYTAASMSLDGYIAGPDESGFDQLFQWYGNGEVEVPTRRPDMTMRMSRESAGYFREVMDTTGALVVGRRIFELTGGWDGTHPLGVPVVVLTHHPPADPPRGNTPFTFVTEGIAPAVAAARELAGGGDVGVNGGMIARQCLDAGLLDEIRVELVPVLLGGGTPFFAQLSDPPVALDGPVEVRQGTSVTHLRYRVRR